MYTAGLTFPTEGTWILSYELPDLDHGRHQRHWLSAHQSCRPHRRAGGSNGQQHRRSAFDPAIAIGVGAAILILLAAALAAPVIRERRPDRTQATQPLWAAEGPPSGCARASSGRIP